VSIGETTGRSLHMPARGEVELLAQELSGLRHKVEDLEGRIVGVERMNARLEEAALSTARALAEISGHWDALYEAMRRRDASQEAGER
jgi:predicted nuclease with TOPRIM domain